MMDQTLLFPGLRRAVVLRHAPRMAAALTSVLHGWVPVVSRARRAALSRVTGHDRGQGAGQGDGSGGAYAVDSPWLDAPFADLSLVSAVTAVTADLSEDWVEDRPGTLALHAGGVEIGGRLIAFAGTHRAGKSTLAARLTAEADLRLFADDVLPLTADGRAVALGIAPRLRLPLPATATPGFRAHVAATLRLRDARYGYLDRGLVAPHGATAPLGAFLVLSRVDGAPARLHRMDRAEAIAAILAQNMSHADAVVHDQAVMIAETLPCLRLVYADLEDAVALLRRAFGGAVWPAPDVAIAAPLPATQPEPPPPVAADTRWRRDRGTVLLRRGTVVWLSQAATQQMVQVNPVAEAIWQMLEDPASARVLAEALSDAFPATAQAAILADCTALLGAFAEGGLIRPA